MCGLQCPPLFAVSACCARRHCSLIPRSSRAHPESLLPRPSPHDQTRELVRRIRHIDVIEHDGLQAPPGRGRHPEERRAWHRRDLKPAVLGGHSRSTRHRRSSAARWTAGGPPVVRTHGSARSTTSSCSVDGTTARCTKAGSRSCATRTARSPSFGPMVDAWNTRRHRLDGPPRRLRRRPRSTDSSAPARSSRARGVSRRRASRSGPTPSAHGAARPSTSSGPSMSSTGPRWRIYVESTEPPGVL